MTDKNIHPEDQVNLAGIRTLVYELLWVFFKGLSLIGFCFRKYKYFITLAFVSGMALGYGYYGLKPSHYKASMIVQFNKLNKRTYSEMIDQLNHLLATVPTARLARELQVSESVAGKLQSVTALTMDDHALSVDTSTRVDQPFKIVAGVRDDFDLVLDTLSTGILNYLNYSPYLNRLNEEGRKANQVKLAVIDADLAKLDTLKSEYNRFIVSAKISSTVYNDAINPADFYAQGVKLLAERDLTVKALNVDRQPVAVVDGFKLIESPGPSAIPRLIILFGIGAAILAWLAAILAETKTRMMKQAPATPSQAQK
jgi:hypothetical protein